MILRDMFRICEDNNTLIEFLRNKGILKSHILCPDCGNQMYTDYNLKMFRCQRSRYEVNQYRRRIRIKCNKSVSVLDGSWFSGFKIGLQTIFIIIFLYIHHDVYTLEALIKESGASKGSVIKVCKRINELLDDWLDDCNQVKIGGRGVVVEVDEVCWGGRKLRLGRPVGPKQWIFGLKERISGRLIVSVIPDRSAATLEAIILRHVKRGSIINTDCWPAYEGLGQLNYGHLHVNHRLYHINRVNRCHIQVLERSWRELRRLVPKYGESGLGVGRRLSKFVFTYSTERLDRVPAFLTLLENYHGPDE